MNLKVMVIVSTVFLMGMIVAGFYLWRPDGSLGSPDFSGQTEWITVRPNGTFSARFTKDRLFDIPLADSKNKGKFVRVLIKKGLMSGKTEESETKKNKFPVKVLKFAKPNLMVVDVLDGKRDSIIPWIAKLFGVSPNVLSIVCYQTKEAWSVAPQLSGEGAVENPGLIRDLLKINDEMDPGDLEKP